MSQPHTAQIISARQHVCHARAKTSQLQRGARESGCPRQRSGNHVFRFNFSAVPVSSQVFWFFGDVETGERRDASEVA